MSTQIMNNATINYTFSGSTESYNQTSNDAIVNLQDTNGITVVKESESNTFSPNSSHTFVITITNSGLSYFSGVRVIDDLAGGNYLRYVQGSAVLFYNGQYLRPQIAGTNPLTFTLSPLSSGQTMVLTYTCSVPASVPASITELTNTVQAIGYTFDSTVTASDSYTLTRTASANITITKQPSKASVAPNENFYYTITATNSGTTTANVSSITDSLPANFKLVSATLQIGSGSTITLTSSDYNLDSSNNFTLPSNTGPTITVPAGGTTKIVLNGYLTAV